MKTGVARPLTLLLFLFAAGSSIAAAQQNAPPAAPAPPPLVLTSTAFADSTPLPTKFSCAAQPAAVSPPLQWSDVPKETVSFALMLHDLEPRPRKGVDDILHWMIYNIPGDARQLPEGVPSGAQLKDGSMQAKNNAGDPSYRGPCAGPGLAHHYTFELFALDQKLDVPPGAARSDVWKAMDGHIVGHAVLIGLFHR